MSHYVDLVTLIKDKKALIRALGRMGFKDKIDVSEKAMNLYGYRGDVRPEKAHVILRRKYVGTASNDIGFEETAKGFVAHISEYDQGTGQYASNNGTYGTEWQHRLYTYYGVERAKMEYESRGYSYTEDVDEKDRPRLRATI